MKTTTLGRTGLETSLIGIGLEHVKGQPRDTVVATIRRAIERGVTTFDVIFSMPDYLDNVAAGFRGHRDQLLVTGHLGSTDKDGQYQKTRALKRCWAAFHDVLERLDTDCVDILFLHNFNSLKDWERSSGGYLDMALRLRDQGKARFLGVSGHETAVINRILDEGIVDVAMFPVNLFNHAMPNRDELLARCAREGIGLVAMKPFGGGRLLTTRGSLRVPRYQAAGEAYRTTIKSEITPVQCLSYAMSRVGVTMPLPGVKNPEELEAALEILTADKEARDFSALLTDFDRYVDGQCTYCNHCLPCPAHIDIAEVNRLLDQADLQSVSSLRRAYDAMPAPASACTACGACTPRCPFGVDPMARVQQAATVFEAHHPRRPRRPG